MGWFVSFLAGCILTILVIDDIMNEACVKGLEAQNIIEECEKSLPRNEYCKIVAVPKTEEEE